MNNASLVSVSALVLALVGCGGSPAPEGPLSTSLLQGIWRSPASAASTTSAVVLPDGKMWALVSNASSTRVLKAAFVGQPHGFDGSGKSFVLATTSSNSISMTASVVEGSSLSAAIGTGSQAENFSLAYQARYASAAQLADFAGAWQATLGPGIVNWTLSETGVLNGTRTTGCTYSGTLSLRAERKAIVDVAVSEDCAGALTLLSGIAVESEDKASINMLLTNKDETAAVALSLVWPGGQL